MDNEIIITPPSDDGIGNTDINTGYFDTGKDDSNKQEMLVLLKNRRAEVHEWMLECDMYLRGKL